MVTANIIKRTLHIRRADKTGSAFTFDRGGKQYLVTARHVVEGITSGGSIFVGQEKQWKTVDINVVGIGDGEVDVAVLACQLQLSPTLPLEPSGPEARFSYGQEAYFLGFPFGWDSGGEHMNNGLPFPFVKAGIISAFTIGDAPVHKIYLDAHANEGFSGGPVVFSPLDGQKKGLHVAGVVVSYPKRFQPVVDDHGNTVAHAQENPGLVLAISFSHVVALIDANPIGFVLPSQAV